MILPQLILQVSAALYPYISSSRIQLFGCEKISGRFRVTDYSRVVLIYGRTIVKEWVREKEKTW